MFLIIDPSIVQVPDPTQGQGLAPAPCRHNPLSPTEASIPVSPGLIRGIAGQTQHGHASMGGRK